MSVDESGDKGLHGPEWEPAVQLLGEMQIRRGGGETRHESVKALEMQFWCVQELHGRARNDREWTREEVLSVAPQAVENAGVEVLLAWLNNDFAFFEEFARVEVIASGKRSKRDKIPYEEVIDTAWDLCTPEKGNPSREEVKQAVEAKGVVVSDWTKAFKKCRLDFLKGRPRGRPKRRNLE